MISLSERGQSGVAKLDGVIERLQSEELVKEVSEMMVLDIGFGSDSPGFEACVKQNMPEARAAINVIKEGV